jgi:hypothetical protein
VLPEFNPWGAWERPDRDPSTKAKTQNDGAWGSLTSQVTVQDYKTPDWQDPLQKRELHHEDAWKYTMGPLFCFGQVGTDSQEAEGKDMKVVGRTGVGCKVGLGGDGEVLLRSGPTVTCTDPLHPDKSREQSQWLVEIEARYPLLAGIGVEYTGTACPALNPTERDWFNQDVRLAIPVGQNGKFRVGARHHWENYAEPHPLSEGMQLYLGLELFH